MNNSEQNNQRKEDLFFRYFTSNQNEIYSYLLTLLPNSTDADDVFQETSSVMWRKFDDFEPGTDFAAWGCKIAFYVILEYRRKKYRNRIHYSSETLELLCDSFEQLRHERNYRVEYLNRCLRKLSEKEQHLIQLRYNKDCPIKDIAKQSNRSINLIYKTFARIHYFLLECIQHNILTER